MDRRSADQYRGSFPFPTALGSFCATCRPIFIRAPTRGWCLRLGTALRCHGRRRWSFPSRTGGPVDDFGGAPPEPVLLGWDRNYAARARLDLVQRRPTQSVIGLQFI